MRCRRAGGARTVSVVVMVPTRRFAATISLSLVLGACGAASSAPDDAAPVSDAPAATAVPNDAAAATDAPSADAPADEAAVELPDAQTVPAALQFSANLVGGAEFDAATLAGKPTVFWFWAPT